MTAVSLAPAWADVDDDLGYSEFYQRYHRPLTGYLQMGFRDADVEAVAQETFCRALAHWSEVRSMTSPWPWLAVTARNLARNNIRDQRATQPAGLDVFGPDMSAREDVAEQVEASDSLRRLAQSMTVLTPLQRRLLTVMVEEGLTGAQLARRLGMRPGAVRMHLCRMRLRLGERFAALGGVLGISPVALLGALRRFRAKALAGSVPVTLSSVVTAVGIVAIGVLPGVALLPNASAQTPHAVTAPDVSKVAAVSHARSTAQVRAARVAAPAKPMTSREIVASTGPVQVASTVRAGSLTVEKGGQHETVAQVVDRCLHRLTLTPYDVGCEGSGTGTQ